MKRFLSFLFLTFVYLLLATTIHAATLTICSDNTTGCQYVGANGIQQAVEKAVDGDIILMKTGNFYSVNPIVVDPNYKYQNCLIDTRGKKITIRGETGAVLDNGNGGVDDQTKTSTGICVLGGEVTIDSISIKQTLRPAIYLENARAIIKNIKTIDIDNASIDMHQSQAMILNSILTGGGIGVNDISYVRAENNVLFGWITFDLCNNSEPKADVSNNILARGMISANCPEQTQKLANIKLTNNFVYKGDLAGEIHCVGPGFETNVCAPGELCTGVKNEWPGFIGADENGTACVWGEGFIQGDLNTKPDSPATLAGAGISTGPCINADSAGCINYIKNNPLPDPPTQEPPPDQNPQPENPGPVNTANHSSFYPQLINPYNLSAIFGKLIDVPNNINTQGQTNTVSSSDNGIDLMMYIVFSAVYIMFINFAVGIKGEFNIFWVIGYFLLGGIVGGWLHTYEGGFVFAIIMSLIFF